MRTRRFLRLAWMGAGLALGLAVGLALAAGIWLGNKDSGSGAIAGLPLEELKLRAAAAHGSDTFAIATGPMDGNVDGVFMLDFLTGDLTCFVLHPRTGKFSVICKTNVTKDLPVEQGKKPVYALATGRFSVLASATSVRPAASVVYVADCNTGKVAAYSMPWQEGVFKNTTTIIQLPMGLQDVGEARNLKLHD